MEYRTRIDSLTDEEKSKMAEYAEKWIEIGLKTGETDWDTFDKYMPVAYEKAGLKYPKNVVRVSSPLVGALAASVAEGILKKRRGAVRGAVRDAVDGAVGGAVGDAVRGAVGDAVRGAVRGAVGGAVHDAVDGAVGDAVGGAVDGAVGGAVRGAVDGAVETAISIAKKTGVSLSWHYWIGGQFWVGYWWYGIAAVNFLFDICNLKLSKDIMERAEAYRKISESVNYIWPNSDFIMVCARPVKILRDERGRLHSEAGQAIEYPDGWGLYMLHGINFDAPLYWKIVKKEMTSKEALAIPSTDQRAIALQFIGGERLMQDFNGKIIGKDEYGELVELTDLKDSNGEPYKYLRALNPENGQYVYLRTRPEFKTAQEAEAWSYDLSRWGLNYKPISRT